MALAPGTRVGDWIVGTKLGAGGFGTVYRAQHSVLTSMVAALKVLERPDVETAKRFLREAAALDALRHASIVGLKGPPGQAGDVSYLPMELIEGVHLNTADPHVLRAIAEALAYAHTQGVAHRDLKPENVVLRRDGVPVLVDFGLVKGSTDSTLSHGWLGTPVYMAPEQWQGRVAEPHRIDIYAFGVLVYVLSTKRLPFAADDDFDSHGARVLAILRAKEHLPCLDPGPSPYRELIMRCTAREPAARPASMYEVAGWLGAGPAPPPVAPKAQVTDRVPEPPPAQKTDVVPDPPNPLRNQAIRIDRPPEPPSPRGPGLARLALTSTFSTVAVASIVVVSSLLVYWQFPIQSLRAGVPTYRTGIPSDTSLSTSCGSYAKPFLIAEPGPCTLTYTRAGRSCQTQTLIPNWSADPATPQGWTDRLNHWRFAQHEASLGLLDAPSLAALCTDADCPSLPTCSPPQIDQVTATASPNVGAAGETGVVLVAAWDNDDSATNLPCDFDFTASSSALDIAGDGTFTVRRYVPSPIAITATCEGQTTTTSLTTSRLSKRVREKWPDLEGLMETTAWPDSGVRTLWFERINDVEDRQIDQLQEQLRVIATQNALLRQSPW